MAAVKRYNNVQLDGKPMKIEIVGTNIATRTAAPAANVNFGNSNGVPRGYALLLLYAFYFEFHGILNLRLCVKCCVLTCYFFFPLC